MKTSTSAIGAIRMKNKDFKEFLQFSSVMGKKPVCILTVQKALHQIDIVNDFASNE